MKFTRLLVTGRLMMTGRTVRKILARAVPELPNPKRLGKWEKIHFVACAALCGVPACTVQKWAESGVTGIDVFEFFQRLDRTCDALSESLLMRSPEERFNFFIHTNRDLCVRPSVVLWRKDCDDVMRYEIACLADGSLAPSPSLVPVPAH